MTRMDYDVRRTRALASPLRWRILRICLHHARTNKEIAEILDIDPATCLHHVRTLVESDFLAPQEERRGKRGAREVPYLATKATFYDKTVRTENTVQLLTQTMLQEVVGLPDELVEVFRVGFKIPTDKREDWMRRFKELFNELVNEETDLDSEAYSLLCVVHPDPQAD